MDGGVIEHETHGHRPDEARWGMLDDEEGLARIDAAVDEVKLAKARGEFDRPTPTAEPPEPPVPPALPAPAKGVGDASWATPDEQRQLAEIDALIEAAKAKAAAAAGRKRHGINVRPM